LIVQLGTKGKSVADKAGGAIRLAFSNQPISATQIEAFSSINGVQTLSPAVVLWNQKNKTFATITGIDLDRTESGPAKVMQWISKGKALHNNSEAVVESHYARFNKLKVGSTIQFEGRDFHIVGITKIKEGASLAAANFYVSIQDARELANMSEGAANLLSITLRKGTQPETIQEEINMVLPGAMVSSTDSIGDMMQGFARISGAASRILSITALVFTILLACWLIIGRLQEQRWQVGLMQTLGRRRKDIVLSHSVESLTLTVAGCLAGIGLGIIVAVAMGSLDISLSLPWNLRPTPGGMPHNGTGQAIQVPLPITLHYVSIFLGSGAICLAAVITGLLTAVRLAGLGVRQTLLEQ
jgi:ABC-type lipoprotein release transport system permease subunit